ncbi:unnamed protein product, partial [Scytosiphon promiscuus]
VIFPNRHHSWHVFRGSFEGRSARCRRICYGADFASTAIFFGTIWPLMIAGGFFWFLLLALTEAPREWVQRSRRAPQDTSRPSADNRSWENRGWLVVLRARYLGSLVRTTDKPWWWASCITRRGERKKRKPFKLDGMVGAHAAVGDEDKIELGEVSCFDWEFARIVARVTELGEEGVFRQVVLYL